MKWITRERVKMEIAQTTGAIPYDVPGVELGHHGKVPLTVRARGLDPAPAVWPNVIAQHLITLGCAVPTDLPLPPRVIHTDWSDVPLASQDLPGAYAAIQRHVTDLIATLAPTPEVIHG
jgi:hypothetical protein